MAAESKAEEKKAEKLQMRYFGCACGVCRYFVPVGIIAIEETAGVSRLHELLKKQNWQADDAVCERPTCGNRTFVTWDRTILGGKAR